MNLKEIQNEFKASQKEIEHICNSAVDRLEGALDEPETIDEAKRLIQNMCKEGMLDQMELVLRKQGENFHRLADETAKLNKKILEWKPKN